MPSPSRLAAREQIRLHRGPMTGHSPIRTLPAFPTRCFSASITWMLIRATLLRSTVRTVDSGTTCKPGRRRAVAVTDVRSLLLDTGQSGVVSPGWRRILAPEAIVAPTVAGCNGTDGWWLKERSFGSRWPLRPAILIGYLVNHPPPPCFL